MSAAYHDFCRMEVKEARSGLPPGPHEATRACEGSRAAQPSITERAFIGESERTRRLRQLALQVALSEAPVLLAGESGTGKEVLARFIHINSPRASRPFVAINCAALPETLIEAELFGYEKGAYTGATHRKAGAFEEAHTGTLLLDEVCEIRPHLQAKLLRVLQEQEIRPIGSTRTRTVDVRIISASSRDLRVARAAGTLREDLYYRISVVELALPPLRERADDLPLICQHFLDKYAERDRSRLRGISAAALSYMLTYRWPGNVRELENVIRRATALSDAEDGELLLPQHLPPEVRGEQEEPETLAGASELDLPGAVLRLKQARLGQALRQSQGNKSEAARLLGISRRNLYNLLEEVGCSMQ